MTAKKRTKKSAAEPVADAEQSALQPSLPAMSDAAYLALIEAKSLAAPATGIEEIPDLHPSMKPHQVDVTRYALRRGRAALFLDTGLGKALAADSPVLTPDGWIPIGSLTVGQNVIGSDGNPYPVTGVYPQGIRKLFRVKFSDGADIVCDSEHLWAVNTKLRRSRGMPNRIMTLDAIVSEGLKDQGGRRHFIPVVAPVQFSDAALPIDPYTLGALIGDGGLTHGTPCITTDDEIVSFLVLPLGVTAKRSSETEQSVCTWYLSRDGTGSNALTEALESIGLNGHYSYEKFIPRVYKFSSVAQRFALLQGILDTDGSVSSQKEGTCTIEYSTSSEQLSYDVAHLVRSLGGITTTRVRLAPKYTHNGEVRTGRPSYRMTIQMPGTICPFRLQRKAAIWRPRMKYQPNRSIVSVDSAGEGEAVCISVASPDRLFVAKDFVVTHNTRCAIEFARVVYEVTGGKVLILCPLAVAQEFVREAAELRETFSVTPESEVIAEGVTMGVTIHHATVTLHDGINVTNYDKLHLFPVDELAGVILDEASILKHFEGKMRNALIAAFASVPFRLVCTATPAPNDHVELGNYAEFLGVMTMSVMKAKFFSHRDAGEFELKEHGKRAFWQWVASWAAIVRRPSDLGYSDEGYDLPPLRYHEHVVALPPEVMSEILEKQPRMQLSLIPEARTLAEQRDVRRESIDLRAAKVAEILATYPDTEPAIVWVELNPEGVAVRKAIPGIIEVSGSDDNLTKEKHLVGFKSGNPLRITTKPKIAGWGLNYQHCAIAIFIGGDHSYEKRKQTIARIWRFGQKRPCDIHFITTSADGRIVENMKRKEAAAEQMYREMVEFSRDFVRQNVQGARPAMRPYKAEKPMHVPAWLVSERT
jgi:hypothetical protein